jgi:hypothetical protein
MNRLGAIPKKYRPRIVDIIDERNEENGWWLYLTAGWRRDDTDPSHIIHEDTWSAAMSELRITRPCDCHECQELINRGERG